MVGGVAGGVAARVLAGKAAGVAARGVVVDERVESMGGGGKYQFVSPDSECIARARVMPTAGGMGELFVQFQDGTAHEYAIDMDTWWEFKEALSKGEFFNSNIR
jgi:hypothetical protein